MSNKYKDLLLNQECQRCYRHELKVFEVSKCIGKYKTVVPCTAFMGQYEYDRYLLKKKDKGAL